MSDAFPIIPLLIATSFVMITLGVLAWRKRFNGNAAVFLALSMLGVAIYCFGYGMELYSNTLSKVMLWVRFQHLGIFLIVPTWLLFAISVSGYKDLINFKLIIGLSIVPIYLFLSAQTLGGLNLAHHNPRLESLSSYLVLAYDRNLFNYISIGYYTLCIGISTVLFAMMFFRAAPSARKHQLLYLIGSLPPWGTAILYNLELDSSLLDPTPLLLGVSGLFFTFGFLQFRILDLIPLARNTIFDKMGTGVLILDAQNLIVDFNPAFERLFPEVKHDSSVEGLFSPFVELITWFKHQSNERVDFQIVQGENTMSYRVSLSEFSDHKGRGIGKILSFYENTQEKLLLDQLEKIATHDGLTGIFNRQYFDRLAEIELSRLQRYGGDVSLIMVDLDNFKRVNDTFGHGAGDEVLIHVAKIFHSQIRQSDTLARYGGEEFVILLPETDLQSAALLAKRLKQSLADQIIAYDEHRIQIRASFGLTSINDAAGLSLESYYRLADMALYTAKEAGGNRVSVYDPDKDSPVIVPSASIVQLKMD